MLERAGMNRSRFVTFSFLVLVLFIFLKIYQHNRIVSLLYEKQKIERMKGVLKKKKNALLVTLYRLKDQQRVREQAYARGMRPLKPSQVVTVTLCDMLKTFTIRS